VIIGVGPKWGLEPRALGLLSERIVQQCTASLLIVREGERSRQTAANQAGEEVRLSPAVEG
jgi:hypothetical protein